MKQHTTPIHKSAHGNWRLETTLDFDADEFENRQIQITTTKRSSGALVTSMICGEVNDKFFTYVPFQDFNKQLEASSLRATQAAVTNQHYAMLKYVDDLADEVRRFYKLDVPTYEVRKHWEDGRRETLDTGLSRTEAKEMCALPDTSGEVDGVKWMLVFDKE